MFVKEIKWMSFVLKNRLLFDEFDLGDSISRIPVARVLFRVHIAGLNIASSIARVPMARVRYRRVYIPEFHRPSYLFECCGLCVYESSTMQTQLTNNVYFIRAIRLASVSTSLKPQLCYLFWVKFIIFKNICCFCEMESASRIITTFHFKCFSTLY